MRSHQRQLNRAVCELYRSETQRLQSELDIAEQLNTGQTTQSKVSVTVIRTGWAIKRASFIFRITLANMDRF